MDAQAAYQRPRYGKEILERRLKVWSPDKGWRNGTIKAYHGGYLRHTVVFDTGEKTNTQLYQERYEFLAQGAAKPVEELVNKSISIQNGVDSKWVTGDVVGFDGILHTVLLDDGEYQHVNLQQQPYKLVDRPPGTAVARRKSTTPTPPPVPALGVKTAKSAEPSSGGRTAPRSLEPPSAQGQQVSEAGSEGVKLGRAGSVDADGPKSDGPVRRSTRAAAMAVTAATKQQQIEAQAPPRERSPVAAAVVVAGPPPPPRQAPLNMSNVGRKDREAARALLGFTAMALGSAQAEVNGSAVRSSEEPDSGGRQRRAIAAAAAAAAAAAGLSEPLVRASSPGTADGRTAAAFDAAGEAAARSRSQSPTAGAGSGGGAAAAGGLASPPAAAALAASGAAAGLLAGANAAGLGHLLLGLQQQMQQLVKQEQKRSLEVVTLRSKAVNAQAERDEALKERDTAVRERDIMQDKMQGLQDDNRALKTQAELLERQLMQMQAQLSVEHGMVGGLSMDAAALQAQITTLRSEMASVKAESSHLLVQIRNISAAAAVEPNKTLAVSAFQSSPKGNAAAAGGREAAANAPAAAVGAAPGKSTAGSSGGARVGPVGQGGRAAASSQAGGPRLDPAAAAALPVPVDQAQPLQQQQQQQRVPAQRMMALKPSADNRASGVGQLMIVGPGKLVVGPNSRSGAFQLMPRAASMQAEAAKSPAAEVQQQQQQQQQRSQQQQAGAAEVTVKAEAPAADVGAADAPKSQPLGAADTDMAPAGPVEAQADQQQQQQGVIGQKQPSPKSGAAGDGGGANGVDLLTATEAFLPGSDEGSAEPIEQQQQQQQRQLPSAKQMGQPGSVPPSRSGSPSPAPSQQQQRQEDGGVGSMKRKRSESSDLPEPKSFRLAADAAPPAAAGGGGDGGDVRASSADLRAAVQADLTATVHPDLKAGAQAAPPQAPLAEAAAAAQAGTAADTASPAITGQQRKEPWTGLTAQQQQQAIVPI